MMDSSNNIAINRPRGSFFASAVNNENSSPDSSSSSSLSSLPSPTSSSLKVTYFHQLKHSDFQLRVLGQVQFELVFKQQDVSFIMEAASIGTMWSTMSALTNVIKELNYRANNNDSSATSTNLSSSSSSSPSSSTTASIIDVDSDSADNQQSTLTASDSTDHSASSSSSSWCQYYMNLCNKSSLASSHSSTANMASVLSSSSSASLSTMATTNAEEHANGVGVITPTSLSSITDSIIERSSDYNKLENGTSEKLEYFCLLIVLCGLSTQTNTFPTSQNATFDSIFFCLPLSPSYNAMYYYNEQQSQKR